MNWRKLLNFGKFLRTSRPHPTTIRRQVYISSLIVVQEPNVPVQSVFIIDAERGLPPDDALIAIFLN
jgi:hypothetical protein